MFIRASSFSFFNTTISPRTLRWVLLLWVGAQLTGCMMYDPSSWETSYSLVERIDCSSCCSAGCEADHEHRYPYDWNTLMKFRPARAEKTSTGDVILTYPYHARSKGVFPRPEEFGYRELKIRKRKLRALDELRPIHHLKFPVEVLGEPVAGASPKLVPPGEPLAVKFLDRSGDQAFDPHEERLMIYANAVVYWYVPRSGDDVSAFVASVELPETKLAWYGYPLRAIEVPLVHVMLAAATPLFILSYYTGGEVP